ncbi:MAG TPA: zf-HC2 domain-containing protein [Thermoanaerobaculia bacterium]|nr:zf-HC2 domain-containing protein [Thermoanaerobaculia bacterium]
MSGHAAIEALSALVDGELGEPERRELETHLAGCAPCRARLEGLRRVAGELGALGRPAPPPTLDLWVSRRVAIERGESAGSWKVRLERWSAPGALLGPFAIVLGLAIAVYVLAHAMARSERPADGTRIVVVPIERLLGAEAVEIEGRTFRRDARGWVEAGNAEIPGPAEPLGREERHEVLDRFPELRALLADGRVELVWRGARRVVEPPS